MLASVPDTRSGAIACFGRKVSRICAGEPLRHLGDVGKVGERARVAVEELVGLAVGLHEAVDRLRPRREHGGVDDMHAHRLPRCFRHVAAARDEPDAAVVERIEPERRRCPADVDLPAHRLGERHRGGAGRDRPRLDVEMLEERDERDVGRGAVGRIGDGLAGGILERADRRSGGHVPVEVAGAGDARRDDPHRGALGERSHHRAGPRRDPDVDAAGDHRLHRLPAPVGIEELQIDAVVAEDAGALADRGDAGVPVAGRADRELERFRRLGCAWRSRARHCDQRRRHRHVPRPTRSKA